MQEVSYQVRVILTWPDGKLFDEPTNKTMEFVIAAAVEREVVGELPVSETGGLGVSVSSERLDR